ncbi:MAG: SDR family oxidoreductase [Phycisphaerales bacterium]
MRILVTGATGYIGGRLVPGLLEAGHEVGVFVRDSDRLGSTIDRTRVRIVQADLLDETSFSADDLERYDAAYYLVHSMLGGGDFEERDKTAARNFATKANEAGIGHVIYLGGIQPEEEEGKQASPHLRSRAETGRVLSELLPDRVTEFRAGPIIGSGSASFEMVRYLTERLPVMLTPRWVKNTVQPVSVRDVLEYLEASLDVGPSGIVPIGADRLTFRELMQTYARVRGLTKRVILPTPFLAPRLAARWVGFVTPIPNRLAVPLIEGVVRPLTADTAKARDLFPEVKPLSTEVAVRRALQRTEKNMVETRWTGAMVAHDPLDLADEEGLFREVRRFTVDASQAEVYRAFASIGGEVGWLAFDWLWRIRGVLDSLIGGPGLRRGRRHPFDLDEGEALDFWRVEKVQPPESLRLRAEMRLPGRAWLQWETQPDKSDPNGKTLLTQTALFEPKGVPGFLYWYAMYPAHLFIFGAMVRAVGRRAERLRESDPLEATDDTERIAQSPGSEAPAR